MAFSVFLHLLMLFWCHPPTPKSNCSSFVWTPPYSSLQLFFVSLSPGLEITMNGIRSLPASITSWVGSAGLSTMGRCPLKTLLPAATQATARSPLSRWARAGMGVIVSGKGVSDGPPTVNHETPNADLVREAYSSLTLRHTHTLTHRHGYTLTQILTHTQLPMPKYPSLPVNSQD